MTKQHPNPPAENLGTLPTFTPVPRAKERSNGWKPDVQRAFIEALADTGSVRAACKRVNRADHGAYLLRRHPDAAEFRKAWQVALDIGMQKIEDVAMDRALNGVKVPVYSYGKQVGERTIYNDRLLMFMLRNRAPERFATGPNGGGSLKGLNAVGKMEKRRLKKKWRAQLEKKWEAEYENEQEVLDSIDNQIERCKQEWEDRDARSSPATLAARAEYERLQAEDEANGYDCTKDPDHPLYEQPDPSADAKSSGMHTDPVALPPPNWHKKPEPEPDAGPRIRTIKDDGWG